MNPQLGTFMLGSVLVVTIADAPDWRMRPYVALLSIGIVLALIEGTQPRLASGFAGLILAGLLVQRGTALGSRIGSIVGE